MDKREIQEWLRRNSDRTGIPDPEIADVDKGEGNFNFIVESGKGKYIARSPREVSENRLKKEGLVLDFLNQQGIERVPQKIFFGEEEIGTVLIETYLGTRELGTEKLAGKRIEDLAELLSRIHSVPVEEYNSCFGEDRQEKRSLRDIYMEDFRQWSEKRVEEYLREADNPDERLEKYSRQQLEMIEEADIDLEVPQSFTHGDLSHNIRFDRENVYIVDWELSRIGYHVHDILQLIEKHGMSPEQRERFLDAYRKRNDLPGYSITSQIYPRMLAFNDTVWAANRMVRAGAEEKERYREMFDKRMERLERMYDG